MSREGEIDNRRLSGAGRILRWMRVHLLHAAVVPGGPSGDGTRERQSGASRRTFLTLAATIHSADAFFSPCACLLFATITVWLSNGHS